MRKRLQRLIVWSSRCIIPERLAIGILICCALCFVAWVTYIERDLFFAELIISGLIAVALLSIFMVDVVPWLSSRCKSAFKKHWKYWRIGTVLFLTVVVLRLVVPCPIEGNWDGGRFTCHLCDAHSFIRFIDGKATLYYGESPPQPVGTYERVGWNSYAWMRSPNDMLPIRLHIGWFFIRIKDLEWSFWGHRDFHVFEAQRLMQMGQTNVPSKQAVRPAISSRVETKKQVPSSSDVIAFTADATLADPSGLFKDFKTGKDDLKVILDSYHVIPRRQWLDCYNHVAGGDRPGTIALKDKTIIRWMVRPGGLATLEFPDKTKIYLAKEMPGSITLAEEFLKNNKTASIKEVMNWTDGGSKTVSLSAPGREDLYVTFDGRMPPPTPLPRNVPDTSGRIFIAGPRFVFGQMVPADSEIEKRIITLIQKALNSELSPEEQDSLKGYERIEGLSERKQRLRHALHVLNHFQGLKKS